MISYPTISAAVVLILLSANSATTVSAEYLRDKNKNSSISQNIIDDHDDDHHKKKSKGACFSVEKGIKCTGGAKEGKGIGAKCEGGEKRDFNADAKAEDVLDVVAEGLHSHMQEGYLPEMGDFTDMTMSDNFKIEPGNDSAAVTTSMLQQLQAMEEDISSCDEQLGCEKEVEFGGFFKLEWGCKVKFSKSDGKMQKTTECGMKNYMGAGLKPKEMEDQNTILIKV